ncbi:MAG: hypothetical protein KGL39_15935 [Patescibacteria group bacterium]|nr:hypothetical protein [Patescibacteria group bacterium]
MLTKPACCSDCPLAEFGAGFARPEGQGTLKVALVGEALGETEADEGLPFRPTAPAGSVLERAIKLAGLSRNQFALTNVVSCQPPRNHFEGARWEHAAAAHCKIHRDEFMARFAPKVIVALGNSPLKHLTEMSGRASEDQSISDLRGYPIPARDYPGVWVLPTYHPSFLRRGKKAGQDGGMGLLGVLIHDLLKAVQIARHGHQVLPVEYQEHPSLDDARAFLNRARGESGQLLTYDIETPNSRKLAEDERENDPSYEILSVQFSLGPQTGIFFPWQPPFVEIARELLALPNPKLGANVWAYDNPRLRAQGCGINGRVDDLQYCFHHLQPDLRCGLQTVVSFYGGDAAWKHIKHASPEFYGIADVDYPQRAWPQIEEALRKKGLWKGYDDLVRGFHPILADMTRRGIPVDDDARLTLQAALIEERDREGMEMQSLVPASLRNVLPKAGYKKAPKSTEGMIQREFPGEDGGGPVMRWCKVQPFLPNSSQQILRYIKAAGHPIPRNFKTLEETTEAEELRRLGAKTGDPIYTKILAYRKAAKAVSTYTMGWAPDPRDGCVHPQFGFRPATGQTSSYRPNCFSGDTEILTSEGWMRFDQFSDGLSVAAYSMDSGEVKFEVPSRIIHRELGSNEYLVHVKTELFIDLLMTSDHNCWLRNRKTSAWGVFKAEVYPEDWQQICAGIYTQGRKSHTQAEIALLCATQADAHLTRGHQAVYSFSKKRKIERLRWALQTLGVPFRETTRKNRKVVNITVNRVDWPAALRNYGDMKSFGAWLLDFDSATRDKFAREVFFWDGYHAGQTMYGSSQKSNADWVQIMLTLSGTRARLRKYHNGLKNSVVNYQIDATPREYSLTTNRTIEKVAPIGKVHCVTVSTGMIVVRRDGVVTITGNCQNFPKHGGQAKLMRKMIAAQPGHVLVEFDFKSFHALTLGFEAQDPDYMRAARLDIHSLVSGEILKVHKAAKLWEKSDEELREYFDWYKSDPERKAHRDKKSKPCILGIGFGLGTRKLYQMNLDSFDSERDARQVKGVVQGLFPRVFVFQDATRRLAHSQGYLISKWSFIRWFWEVMRYDPRKYNSGGTRGDWVPGEDSESAIAFLPANDAFGHIRSNMVALRDRGLDERFGLINTIHDSLVFHAPESIVEECVATVGGIMRAPSPVLVDPVVAPTGLVCDVEASVGPNQAEMSTVPIPTLALI